MGKNANATEKSQRRIIFSHWACDSFCDFNRVHLDRFSLGVQRTHDSDSLSRELFWFLLVAQIVGALAVIQDVRGAMETDAGTGTLSVRRSHSHLGVIRFGAHIVCNDAGERLLA
jgi:hypothetical protein